LRCDSEHTGFWPDCVSGVHRLTQQRRTSLLTSDEVAKPNETNEGKYKGKRV